MSPTKKSKNMNIAKTATQSHYGQSGEAGMSVQCTTYRPAFGYKTDTGISCQVSADSPQEALECGKREVEVAKKQSLSEAIKCGAVIGESSERDWNLLLSAARLIAFCEIIGETHALEFSKDDTESKL